MRKGYPCALSAALVFAIDIVFNIFYDMILYYIILYDIIPVVPGRAGGGSFYLV